MAPASPSASPLQHRVDVGTLIAGEEPLAVATDVFIPPRIAGPPTVLCCLPGGALTRGYYHLQASSGSEADGGRGDFSFAAWMTSQGFIVVTIDPIGIGGSSRPRDGFELTPDVLVAANVRAVESIREDLASGSLTDRLPPLPGLRTVGVGHSMGAMLTAMQQARDNQHVAVMLMGFGTQGLPGALSSEAAAFAGDPVRARENVVRLARARGDDPYPEIPQSRQARAIFAGESAERRGVDALQSARAPLLVTAGLFSMIPGSSAEECARIAVPVFLAVGDRDIAGPPHQIPASFPASSDVTLLVLPATGHCHFLVPSRRRLFQRAAEWAHAAVRP
jgi:pimeloyl-ACP methyl ester carboxylesterase